MIQILIWFHDLGIFIGPIHKIFTHDYISNVNKVNLNVLMEFYCVKRTVMIKYLIYIEGFF